MPPRKLVTVLELETPLVAPSLPHRNGNMDENQVWRRGQSQVKEGAAATFLKLLQRKSGN